MIQDDLKVQLVTSAVKHNEISCTFADTLIDNTDIVAKKTKLIEYT